eukprot:Lithocolla_globosa_v1_NODE_889_length_3132_cov_32.363844.p4 type:complete len:104 gc:universal NODE_889_length_3132_cov_32.363844:893-1204(+)
MSELDFPPTVLTVVTIPVELTSPLNEPLKLTLVVALVDVSALPVRSPMNVLEVITLPSNEPFISRYTNVLGVGSGVLSSKAIVTVVAISFEDFPPTKSTDVVV